MFLNSSFCFASKNNCNVSCHFATLILGQNTILIAVGSLLQNTCAIITVFLHELGFAWLLDAKCEIFAQSTPVARLYIALQAKQNC